MMENSISVNCLGFVVVAIALLSGNERAQSEVDGESSERTTMVIYPMSHFPVWRLDADGNAQFDATMAIAYIKDHVGPGAWSESTLIVPLEKHAGLIIRQTHNNHEKIRLALERLGSFSAESAHERIAQKLADGKLSYQRVLVFIADPNSESTRQFFDLKSDHDDRDVQKAMANYLLQCVRYDQTELLKELNLPAPKQNGATLAILNTEGDVVAESVLNQLSQEGRLDRSLLVEFLNTHAPTIANAREELVAAYEIAGRDEKRLLVQVSGPNCGPCIMLARLFESQAERIQKDYVYVKLDTRMLEATEVISQLRGNANGPVPWMTILSSDGRTLVTSERSGMNIGYPRSEAAKSHFQHMLESTSKRLTGSEIDAIMSALED
jgi:hypothetical protein